MGDESCLLLLPEAPKTNITSMCCRTTLADLQFGSVGTFNYRGSASDRRQRSQQCQRFTGSPMSVTSPLKRLLCQTAVAFAIENGWRHASFVVESTLQASRSGNDCM